jgi:hypothetical protein
MSWVWGSSLTRGEYRFWIFCATELGVCVCACVWVSLRMCRASDFSTEPQDTALWQVHVPQLAAGCSFATTRLRRRLLWGMMLWPSQYSCFSCLSAGSGCLLKLTQTCSQAPARGRQCQGGRLSPAFVPQLLRLNSQVYDSA